MNYLESKEIKMTSLELAELTGKDHKHIMRDIRKEIEELGSEIGESIFGLGSYKDKQNQERPAYTFGKEGAMQLSLKYDALTRYKVVKHIEELQNTNNKPQSIEDLIILQAQSVKEVKEQLKSIVEDNNKIKQRIDNLDNIDIDGNEQQTLNSMVRKLAQQNGLTFSNAWKEFKNAFNTAYNTNLKSKINNYCNKHGFKSLTAPQYLSLTNSLKDAIRVADKLLNK